MEKTLRDEFAMAAMQALITHYGDEGVGCAQSAYAIADAMMKQREVK